MSANTSPTSSEKDWLKTQQCISCLARGLDIKQCPFYDVCPTCGGDSDDHAEDCPFRTHAPAQNYFRLHKLEPNKTAWWDYLDDFGPRSLAASFIPSHLSLVSPDIRRAVLHPYPQFSAKTTLPMHKTAIRMAWDNECREYGITNPADPPEYIRDVPPHHAFRKRKPDSSSSAMTWKHNTKQHRPTQTVEMGGRSGVIPQKCQDPIGRGPQNSRSVPMSLVAPGMKSTSQELFNTLEFGTNTPLTLVRFPSSLADVAKELVFSIRDGNHPEISYADYAAEIQQHGVDALVDILLSFVHPTIFELQGKELTQDNLKRVQEEQLDNQSTLSWPEFGGYVDFVTDDRHHQYVRFYVGQSLMIILRLDTHCRHILQGAIDTLHYFILNSGGGRRRANWLQLWAMPKQLQYMETFSSFSISIIQCCLEMMFCRAFQSLPAQTLVEYFGPAPDGQYAGIGLNVLSPLLQSANSFSLEGIRGQHRFRLSSSSDPEIASWPGIRTQMIAKQRQDTRAAGPDVPASISAYGRLIEEQLQAQNVQRYALDALLSKSRPPTGYFHLNHQFTGAFGESDHCHTLPFGSLNAKVCVVMDNRHIDIGTKTSDSGWIPWLLRCVGFHQENTLLFTYNHTYRGIYDAIETTEDLDNLERRQKFTSLLINKNDVRIVLLCGPVSTDEILASLRYGTPAQGPYTLHFRGQKVLCWIQRFRDNSICRMFVECPEPFPILLSGNWRLSMKLGEVFKIAIALTDIKLDPYHFENCSFRAKVVKELWLLGRNLDHAPWTPDNLDPAVRHYLQRCGFTTVEQLEELRNTNSKKCLTRALVVYLHCCRRDNQLPKRLVKSRRRPSSNAAEKNSSEHQVIEKHEMEAVSKLYTDAETRRRALQPTETPLISTANEEHIVVKVIEPEITSADDHFQSIERDETVESNISDDILLDQREALDTRHADSMDDATQEPDIGISPTVDMVQTLLNYEGVMSNYRNGSLALDQVRLSPFKDNPDFTVANLFDSDSLVSDLLQHGRKYKCGAHAETKGRFLEIKYLSIKIPDNMKSITIRPELAQHGQVHPHRFIRKFLSEHEPAARLAIKGWGKKEDGSTFNNWLYDTIGQEDHVTTALRIFRANTIVDWLEGSIASVSLRPHRYCTKSEKTSSVEDFVAEYRDKWM